MNKETVGEYALLRFELGGENISKLDEQLKLDKAIFRIQYTRLPEVAPAS
jgi:ribosomal protein S6